MRLLAIDTALEACSVAVFDTAHGDIAVSESQPMVRGHAEALMPLIAGVMDTTGLSFANIDRVAVTIGPGSFTGLRVGLAAARGIGLAAGKPVVGLTTLAAFAAPHIAQDGTSSVTAVIDARHSQVYLQRFGPAGRTVIAPRIATIDEVVRIAVNGHACLVGTAAKLVAAHWPAGAPAPRIDDRRAPDIGWVARLGAAASEGQFPPKPLYLRAPDAQPQDAAQLPRR